MIGKYAQNLRMMEDLKIYEEKFFYRGVTFYHISGLRE